MAHVRFIEFPNVKGYATYERAKKRGEEVAGWLAGAHKEKDHVTWVVLPAQPGRWLPAFNVANAPGLAGWLAQQTNVGVFN
jgi:hypothetical protein